MLKQILNDPISLNKPMKTDIILRILQGVSLNYTPEVISDEINMFINTLFVNARRNMIKEEYEENDNLLDKTIKFMKKSISKPTHEEIFLHELEKLNPNDLKSNFENIKKKFKELDKEFEARKTTKCDFEFDKQIVKVKNFGKFIDDIDELLKKKLGSIKGNLESSNEKLEKLNSLISTEEVKKFKIQNFT